MQNILDAVNKDDIPTLQKYGILDEQGKEKKEGTLDYIKNNSQRDIDNSHTIKVCLIIILLMLLQILSQH